MTLAAGETYFYGRFSPERRVPTHLWIVVTDPFGDPPMVPVVSISTRRPESEDTVVLRSGDHPFVRRESVIFYPDTRMVRADQLEALLQSGAGARHAKCSAELLARVQRGLLDSENVERWIKEMCRGAIDVSGA